MKWSLLALVIGFIIDYFLGDPQGFPHPIVLIGRLISALERGLRRLSDLLFRSRLIGSNAPYVRMPELMPTTPIRTRAFPETKADFPV